MNIGLDSAWYGQRPAYKAIADNLQRFLWGKEPFMTYTIDGEAKAAARAAPNGDHRHHRGGFAGNGYAAFPGMGAANSGTRRRARARRRYYDNCLYFFCLLMLAGRIPGIRLTAGVHTRRQCSYLCSFSG